MFFFKVLYRSNKTIINHTKCSMFVEREVLLDVQGYLKERKA